MSGLLKANCSSFIYRVMFGCILMGSTHTRFALKVFNYRVYLVRDLIYA